MHKFIEKLVSLGTLLILFGTVATSCSNNTTGSNSTSSDTTAASNPSGQSSDSTEGASKYKDFITVDVYDDQANYQGIQSGWFADIVKKKFNMELNMIAPNVAGGGDTLFQTRSAAGNIGDIIMMGAENNRLADSVQAGLIYDMTDLMKTMPNVSKYTKALDMIKNYIKSDKIYGIPSSASSQPATNPSEGLDLTFGPYVRWDTYESVGAPEINTLEDLLPVLKSMQDKMPTSDSGKKTYAISLFKDWDGNMMCLAKQPTCFYGYDELGFVLSKADGTDDQSIIDSNSQYVRALKFYYQANQMGILDPESTTQNYDTLYEKYKDGAILFSPWPWLGKAAYNTVEHKEAGKGFMISPVKDMKIFSYGATPSGSKFIVTIGSKAKDPQRMADFIDWLYSPEGIMASCAQVSGTCGPEGLTWKMDNGKPVLTDFGKEALLNGDATMPADWGGGSWKDGVSQLNFATVLTTDINPINNAPYNYTLWDSVLELNNTPLDSDWNTKMNAKTTLDYLEQHDAYIVAPGTAFIAPADSSDISTLRAQCKAIIVQDSWKMVFAKDENEFNSLLKEMQDTVKGLGYDQVLSFDMQNAKDQSAARAEARK